MARINHASHVSCRVPNDDFMVGLSPDHGRIMLRRSAWMGQTVQPYQPYRVSNYYGNSHRFNPHFFRGLCFFLALDISRDL